MTFLQLNYILAIAEEKNITRAAEKLHVAQPSLSRMLSNIEAEYGVELFQRTDNKMELTRSGSLFIKYAQNLVNMHRNLKSALQDISGTQTGKLTFGCSANHMGYLLPTLLRELSLCHPNLELSVVDEPSNVLFRQASLGKIDIVYSHVNGDKYNDLIYLPIANEELLLVVPQNHVLAARAEGHPDWRDREAILLRDIENEPFIQVRKSHSIYTITNKLFSEHGFTPNVKYSIGTNVVAHHLVASGLGISILPESELRFNPTTPPCVFFPIEDRTCTRTIYVGYQKYTLPTALVTQCVELIQNITRQIFHGPAQEYLST